MTNTRESTLNLNLLSWLKHFSFNPCHTYISSIKTNQISSIPFMNRMKLETFGMQKLLCGCSQSSITLTESKPDVSFLIAMIYLRRFLQG